MQRKIPPILLYAVMAGMLASGTLNTTFLKLQNQIRITSKTSSTDNDYKNPDTFTHPFFQAFTMFIGEMLWLFIYFIYWYIQKKKNKNIESSPEIANALRNGLKVEINVFLFIIPAILDIWSSTMLFVSLLLIPASIFQMMRGIIVFFTAIASMIFLNRRYHRHHWTALSFVVIGVAIVGVSPFIPPKKRDERDHDQYSGNNIIAGVILILLAQIFGSLMFVVEEKLFRDYYLHPLKVVGWEGFWGTLIFWVLLIIFSFIPCGISEGCSNHQLASPIAAIKQIFSNYKLLLLVLGSIISTATFTGCGISVTKYASAAQRMTIDTSRTLFIWIIFIINTRAGEALEVFLWPQPIGFVLMVIGTLVFNEILVIPFWGFNAQLTWNQLQNEVSECAYDTEATELLNSLESEEEYHLDKSSARDMGEVRKNGVSVLNSRGSVQSNKGANRSRSFLVESDKNSAKRSSSSRYRSSSFENSEKGVI